MLQAERSCHLYAAVQESGTLISQSDNVAFLPNYQMRNMIKFFLRLSKPLRYGLDDATFRALKKGDQLKDLKDRFRDQPLLIVGNGPSLNKTPLDEFIGVPAIAMNKINLIFHRVAWRPSFILCINDVVVKQHANQFEDSEIPVYLAWKSRWFAQDSPSIRYMNMSLSEDFSTDISIRVGAAATVTYPALQFAYFTGADPVILVGIDHSFDKTGSSHSYEKRSGIDVNHFDPNYFQAGTIWGLPDLEASERAYRYARNAFEKAGRRVLDATVDGKLRVFEKISIGEAIKIASSSQS